MAGGTQHTAPSWRETAGAEETGGTPSHLLASRPAQVFGRSSTSVFERPRWLLFQEKTDRCPPHQRRSAVAASIVTATAVIQHRTRQPVTQRPSDCVPRSAAID